MGQIADRLWSENRYAAAAEQYAAALAEIDQMVTEKDSTLEQTLISAHQALAQGDAAKATELFALAKLMDAENEAALNGLRRAQTYPEVQELIQTGEAHVAQGDLAAGKAAFESALALDPGAQAARAGLKEIGLLRAEAQFKALISEGLRAIERGDLATARSQLVRASQMQPENAAVKDAMARLEQSARVGEIKRLQQNALAAEAKENWEQALAFYLMALELDPNLQFAKNGRISTQDRIRINKRMRFYFENPDALAQDPQLQNAMALLDEAQRLTPRGPALATALAQLEATVAAATTPIKVILTSDGQTQVAVYKIGRLGRFKQHVLDLRPGTYTVVGSRDGYQDVRKQIVIKPKQDSVRIAIACSVKI
jgi:tetratricopeptide (TPR) repeat protein